jgi:hypothetical protein
MQGEKLNNVYPIGVEGKLPQFKRQWRNLNNVYLNEMEWRLLFFKGSGMEWNRS